MQIYFLCFGRLEYGRNTAEHTTRLGNTVPQIEMPHPDYACIGVMTIEKWCHNEVRGPLVGLPGRSHYTLWCTSTAILESPGHFQFFFYSARLILALTLVASSSAASLMANSCCSCVTCFSDCCNCWLRCSNLCSSWKQEKVVVKIVYSVEFLRDW